MRVPRDVDISQRKRDHIDVVSSGRAQHRGTTLLEEVHLVHQSLPELAADHVDLSCEFLGHKLQAPLIITGMTGGTPEAYRINRDLAQLASQLGIAFGVGSQRAMAEHADLAQSYQVRDVAPDAFLLGNLGAVQAQRYGVARVEKLANAIGADAMAIHLNPAQELAQPEGDRDFRGQIEIIQALVRDLAIPVVVKETGCGLSEQTARRLFDVGVVAVDVSGAGGTSWTAVEAERDRGQHNPVADTLRDWGLPTAVTVALCARYNLQIVASGGIRSGLDVARALALGATLGGMAAPVLMAHRDGGIEGAQRYLSGVLATLRSIHLLCGAANAAQLRTCPRHLGTQLRAWLADLSQPSL